MRALIKRYPDNAKSPDEDEIYFEPWLSWISDDGLPLTDGIGVYTYALCEDCPETATLEDFAIEPYTLILEDMEVVRYRAFYQKPNEDLSIEIAKLEQQLAKMRNRALDL